MIRNLKNTTVVNLMIFFLLVVGKTAQGQISCDISINVTQPVCAGEEYIFSAPFHKNAEYLWQKDGIQQEDYVNDSVNKVYIIIDNESLITLTVTDTLTQESCSSSLTVTIHPKFTVEINQLQLTCSNSDTANGNTAKLQAIANGDMDPDKYHYFWDVKPIQIAPGDSSIAIGLMAHQKYFVTVKDNFGCRVRDTAWTKAYPNPVVEIYADPDTAYVQNPFITFSYVNLSEDSIKISSHIWQFIDCDTIQDPTARNACLNNPQRWLDNPTFEYNREGQYVVTLTVYNLQGCDTNYFHTIDIKPVKLFIPNVFTPNSDGVNDYFMIREEKPGSENGQRAGGNGYKPINTYFLSTELYIFNRWGRIVYKSSDYQNDWDGGNLPNGVYFYVLKAHGEVSDEIYKGSVTIFGKPK